MGDDRQQNMLQQCAAQQPDGGKATSSMPPSRKGDFAPEADVHAIVQHRFNNTKHLLIKG